MTTETTVATLCQMPYCNQELEACTKCNPGNPSCWFCLGTGLQCPKHGKNWRYERFSPKIEQIGKWLYEAYCRRSSEPRKLWQYDLMPLEEKQAWLGAVESVLAEHYNQIDELRKVLQKIY